MDFILFQLLISDVFVYFCNAFNFFSVVCIVYYLSDLKYMCMNAQIHGTLGSVQEIYCTRWQWVSNEWHLHASFSVWSCWSASWLLFKWCCIWPFLCLVHCTVQVMTLCSSMTDLSSNTLTPIYRKCQKLLEEIECRHFVFCAKTCRPISVSHLMIQIPQWICGLNINVDWYDECQGGHATWNAVATVPWNCVFISTVMSKG